MLQLHSLGYQLCGTPGTAEYYNANSIPMKSLAKPSTEDLADPGNRKAGDDETVLSWIYDKKIDLVINIPEGSSKKGNIYSQKFFPLHH